MNLKVNTVYINWLISSKFLFLFKLNIHEKIQATE
jgi:hypothetical protein